MLRHHADSTSNLHLFVQEKATDLHGRAVGGGFGRRGRCVYSESE